MFLRQVCIGNFVQAIVTIVGMAGDDAVFGPSGDGVLMDIEALGRFLPCQSARNFDPRSACNLAPTLAPVFRR